MLNAAQDIQMFTEPHEDNPLQKIVIDEVVDSGDDMVPSDEESVASLANVDLSISHWRGSIKSEMVNIKLSENHTFKN